MQTLLDFLAQYQGEIGTASAIIGGRYLPQGWTYLLYKSGDLASWWAEMVHTIRNRRTNKNNGGNSQ